MDKLLNVKNVSISFTQYIKGLHQQNLKITLKKILKI